MTRSSVSIVVRCYNEQDYIGRLLTGIFQQSIKNIEVVIVDSGSTDETLSTASQFPVAISKISPEEFSFGRALNIGCQAAKAEYLVFVSAHVYPVYRDWLERLVAPFADPKVALVYGKQRGDETTKYSEHQIFAKWFPGQSISSQDHPFCNNANVAIRKALWEKLPYDEVLTGLEDIDWAKRAMQLGHKIAYEASAEIIHVHNESLKVIYNRYRREAIALKHIFPEQRFNWWNFIRLFISNAISDYYHAWHNRVIWKNLGSIFVFRLMQFWGTYMGYAQHGPISSQLRQTFYYPHRLLRQETHESKSFGPEPRVRIKYSVKPSVDG